MPSAPPTGAHVFSPSVAATSKLMALLAVARLVANMMVASSNVTAPLQAAMLVRITLFLTPSSGLL